jgi:hypothetical protein
MGFRCAQHRWFSDTTADRAEIVDLGSPRTPATATTQLRRAGPIEPHRKSLKNFASTVSLFFGEAFICAVIPSGQAIRRNANNQVTRRHLSMSISLWKGIHAKNFK